MKPFPPRDVSVVDVNTGLMTQIWFSYFQEQSSTSVQDQVQARQKIYAAPFDSLAYNGMQINGSMDVSQERGQTATSVNASFVCDSWILGVAGTMVVAANQASNGPPGFPFFIFEQITTAEPALGANDYNILSTSIEGYRIARLAWGTVNAQPLSIGFWSGHARTGTYSVSFRNTGATRSYVATYTQNVSSVFEYKTISVPGDVTGTWNTTNAVGIGVSFCVASGTTLTASTANTWLAANYVAAPGQVNGVAAISDRFLLAGLIVLPGLETPSAARSPFIMRPFDQEVVMCRRYLEYPEASLRFAAAGANQFQETGIYYVEKRGTPTITLGAASGGTLNVAATYPQVASATTRSTRYILSSAAAGDCFCLVNQLKVDARI